MNTLDYYNRQKDIWDDKELENIRTEYETNGMNIIQIADIHRRTPGSIAYKIKNLGIISCHSLAKGYFDYISSNLYREIVDSGNKNDRYKKVKKVTEVKIKVEPLVIRVSSSDIVKMKDEIADLKKDVKEMLRLMNALYEFENKEISSSHDKDSSLDYRDVHNLGTWL
jgi:hypothetical protein